MKRKIISLLLCLLMALSLIPTVAFGATEKANLGWKYAVISENADGGGYSIREANSSEDLSNKVTVKIGSETLSKSSNNASTSPQAISSNSRDNVTISVETGYYIAYVVLCCNDGNGYSCQTSRGANAFGMEGSADGSTVTIPVASICNNIPHGYKDKDNFWLMVMVAPIPNPVYVGYESGSINGVPISAAPVIKDGGTDGGTWVADKFIKQYPTTPNTAAPTHNALAISSAAEAEANLKGYTFAGWQLTYYKAYTDGSFSGQTDAGVGGIKSAGDSITLFTNAKLIAQWQEAPQPTIGNLTITKVLAGDGANAAADKAFTFKIMQNDQQVGDSVTITGAGTSIVENLPVGTYTVVEENAAIDGYTYTTTGTGEVEVTANGATVTVTNTYVPATTSVTVTKVWNHGDVPADMQPESVEVNLMNGTTVVRTIELSTANQWTYTFENLPVKDDDGNDITYTVQENDVPDGYAEVTDSADNCFTITNTAQWADENVNPASLTIKKVGEENEPLSGAVFTLTKQNATTADTLTATTADTLTATTDENGTCTFRGLTVGSYTLEETTAPDGYKQTNQTWTIVVEKNANPTEIVLTTDNTKFQKVYDCTVSKLVDNDLSELTDGLTITNEKAPESYSVTLPIQKIVEKKAGSNNPGNTTFAFVATMYDGQTETTTTYGTATIATNGVGTYDDELTITVPADLFYRGNGEILLQVSEVKGTNSNWSYDDTVYIVLIQVNGYEVTRFEVNPEIAAQATDDEAEKPTALTFTNEYSYKYTPTPLPTPPRPVTSVKTGDMGVALYAMTSLLSLSGAAVIIKKRKDEE